MSLEARARHRLSRVTSPREVTKNKPEASHWVTELEGQRAPEDEELVASRGVSGLPWT